MDQSTPAAAKNNEAITQGVPHIDDPFIHNPMHESNGAGQSPTFVLPPLQWRRPIGPQRRGTISHPHQRSHDRTVHHSHSPQGLPEADGTSTLCSSPVSGEIHPSPSLSATMPSSPVSYFSSPPLPRTDEEEEQDIAEEDESDGDKWPDSLHSSSPSDSRERPSRNGFGSHRRSSTGASTLFDSRSGTLLNSPTLNDSNPSKGSSVLHNHGGKLDICEEAEEFSDREKEKLEGSMINDGKGISEEIWPMTPTVLTRNLRYSFRERHIEKRKTECIFEPLKRIFEEDIPKGWRKIIGPEGFPYFWHSKFHIITDTWIPDDETHKRLWDFFKQIQAFMTHHKYQTESNVHLVLDVHEADGKWWCGYYLVDHSNFSVFWFEKTTCAIKELQEIKGGKLSIGFMKVFVEWEYWKHWCLFPDLCPTPPRVWKVAQNYIRNAQTDVLTADRPATNYTFEKLRDMMSIVTEAKESYFLNIGKEGAQSLLPAEECPWFIGRFMEPLARERFLNFYGERHARIDAKQSVHGEKARTELSDTSLLFRILSPLLFLGPEVYFKKMEMLWVDRIVYAEPWNHFFDALSEDWAHQLVYASILLTSNIAFLTVPNVTSEDAVTHGTFVQVPSYVSTIATIGSIILGLALNRQHQNRKRSTKLESSNAEEIHEWLMKRCHKTRGLEPLAVMYSLPYALLMWGMFTFLASFTFMCFDRTTIGARVLAAISLFLIILLVAWFWWMSWDNTTNRWSSACANIQSTFKEWRPLDGLISSWEKRLKKRASPVDPAPAADDVALESGTRNRDASSLASRTTAGSFKKIQRLPHLPLRKTSTHNSC